MTGGTDTMFGTMLGQTLEKICSLSESQNRKWLSISTLVHVSYQNYSMFSNKSGPYSDIIFKMYTCLRSFPSLVPEIIRLQGVADLRFQFISSEESVSVKRSYPIKVWRTRAIFSNKLGYTSGYMHVISEFQNISEWLSKSQFNTSTLSNLLVLKNENGSKWSIFILLFLTATNYSSVLLQPGAKHDKRCCCRCRAMVPSTRTGLHTPCKLSLSGNVVYSCLRRLRRSMSVYPDRHWVQWASRQNLKLVQIGWVLAPCQNWPSFSNKNGLLSDLDFFFLNARMEREL